MFLFVSGNLQANKDILVLASPFLHKGKKEFLAVGPVMLFTKDDQVAILAGTDNFSGQLVINTWRGEEGNYCNSSYQCN